jgi:hypothetical protein
MDLIGHILLFIAVYGALFLVRRLLQALVDRPCRRTPSPAPTPPPESGPPWLTPIRVERPSGRTATPLADKLDHDPLWRKDFRKYLRSPDWKCKRKQVLARASHRCQQCKHAIATTVKHTRWPIRTSHGQFEEEPDLSNLVALCPSCGKEIFNPTPWDDPRHPWWPEAPLLGLARRRTEAEKLYASFK